MGISKNSCIALPGSAAMSAPSSKGGGTPPKAPAVQIVRVDEASISDSEALPQVPDKTNPVSLTVGDKNVKDSLANPPSNPDEVSNQGSSDLNSSNESVGEKDKPKPVAVAIGANQTNPVPPVSQPVKTMPSSSNATVSVTGSGSESLDATVPTVLSIASNGTVYSSGPSSTPLNTTNPTTSGSTASAFQSKSRAGSTSSSVPSTNSSSAFGSTASTTGNTTASSSAAMSSSSAGIPSLSTASSVTPQKQQLRHPPLPSNSSLSTSMSSYMSKNLEDLGATFIVHPKETANYIVNHATDTFNNLVSMRPWSDFRAKHQKQAEEARKNRDRGPLATSTPHSSSKARTIPVSSEGRNIGSISYNNKSDSSVPSLSLSARAFTPSECSEGTEQQDSSNAFDKHDESHASRIKHLLEYVINHVKNLDRVERIRISIERSFPEINSTGTPGKVVKSKLR